MDRGGGGAARFGAGLTEDLFPVTEVAEPRACLLGGRRIPYTLQRSRRRRRISFVVDEQGLAVQAPWRASDRVIEDAMQRAARWIVAKVDEWAARPRRPLRAWTEGETLDYLGRGYGLRLVADGQAAGVLLADAQTLEVRGPRIDDPAAVRALVVKWYRRHAERHFPERVDHFAPRLAVARPRIFLSDAAGRWGSCNSKREVRLNWRLMQAPSHVIDYVVAHELAHLLHLDHSPRFWRAVASVFPDYESARAELAASSRHFMNL